MAQVLSKLAQVLFTKNVGIGTAWMRVKGSRQTCLMHRTVDNGKHLLEVRNFELLVLQYLFFCEIESWIAVTLSLDAN